MLLVTGGAGFIGSNLVAALVGRGRRVAVCDWLGEGDKWRNLAKHEVAALVPPPELFDWLAGEGRGVAAVFHLGAISATTERDGDRLAATNVTLPQRLWHWCAAAGVPLIYASSAATYGDGSQGFVDDGSIQALARLRPLNGYGWSKHLFDRWVARELAEDHPRPPQWAGLKFFNVYGPNEHHKGGMRSVALQLFEQISAGQPATLFQSHRPDYADGGQLRDFVHVDDCVAVMLWLLDHPGVSGLYNVGSGRARSFRDLAEAAFAALGKAPDIRYVPTPEAIRARYQYFTEGCIEKLRAAGYDGPSTGLEEGVRRFYQDFLQQPDPYR